MNVVSKCYDAVKVGYFNMSLFLIFTPMNSMGAAVGGWVLAIVVIVGYIVLMFLAEDD